MDADYVWIAQRNVENIRQSSVTYDPQTGVNYPWTDPTTASVSQLEHRQLPLLRWPVRLPCARDGLTKRFSAGWQLSASYTLAGEWVGRPDPLLPGCQNPATAPGPVCNVPVTLAPDLAGIYYLAGSQRNRFSSTVCGNCRTSSSSRDSIYLATTARTTTTPGADVRVNNTFNGRLRRNGTLIPFNNFDLPSLQRVDMRLQRRFRLGGHMSVDGMVEVFNVFNHVNYDPSLFILNEASASFGRPQPSSNLAFQPRMMQLGVRFVF